MINEVEMAAAEDVAAVAALLEASGLPTEGIDDPHLSLFVLRRKGRIIACSAIEQHGIYALIRSVAVAPEWRRQGLGHLVTEAVLRRASENGAIAVYLLTLTAEKYFPKFGFRVVDRAQVPEAIKRSSEFSRLCPQSAVVMVCSDAKLRERARQGSSEVI